MDEFERGLNTAKEKFDGFADKLSKAGETISNVGGTLTKGITLPLAGLGTAIIKTGMDYEAGMSKVQAISGATGDEMTLLGQKAMEMAAKTKFSTADSAEAYQYMAMAGWKAGDMVDGLAGIMNLAAASGENLGTTSDIVTDALTAFGLKAADSGRFADVLAAASNNANTNVSMLGESFKYVAPVAGALGYSVEDTSIALGLMANSGIKASQAGTSLRTAMTNMASPTKNMAAVMEEYGITLTDADGSMLSLSDVMGQLRERMGGLDESTQAAAAAALFGKEAMSGMLAIINAAPEDFNKLTEAINNSAGTTSEMASVMNDNAAGAMAMLSSAINVLFTNLSQLLIPAFTSVVQKITEVVQWFNNLDESTQKMILTIAGISAAVGPVLVVVGNVISAIGKIASGISGLIGIVTKVGGAFGSLFSILAANPIAIVIAAVAALAVGFTLLWNNCEEFRNFFIGMWESAKEAFGSFASWIGEKIDSIKEFFSGLKENIEEKFENIGTWFQEKFSSISDSASEVTKKAVEFFGELRGSIEEKFGEIGNWFSERWNAIKNGASEAADGAKRKFSEFREFLIEKFEKIHDWFGEKFKSAYEAATSAWSGAKDFFSQKSEDIVKAFSDIGKKFLDIGQNIVDGIKNGVSGAWGSFVGWIEGKVGGIVSAVKNMLGIHSPSTVFAGIGENMALGLAEGWDDEYNAIRRKIEGGLNFGTATVGVTGNYSGAQGSAGSSGKPGFGGDFVVNIYNPEKKDPVTEAREWKKTMQRAAMDYA